MPNDKIRVKAYERSDGTFVPSHERTKPEAAKLEPFGQPTKGVTTMTRDTPQISHPNRRGEKGVRILGRSAPGGIRRVGGK